MGFSQAQKAESKQRVLETASRMIREDGIDALGVADCMRSAGLTHGAFYGHFASRDALILEALEHAVGQSEKRMALRATQGPKAGESALKAYSGVFLNERHVKNAGAGCALCALAGEARHASPEVRTVLTDYVRKMESRIVQAAHAAAGSSEDRVGTALGIVATLVGAVTLARAVDSDKLAKSILASSLALILTQDAALQ
jgi:TetR/AcrR family transcriptional regulator, transcriptional repressor for nem operon